MPSAENEETGNAHNQRGYLTAPMDRNTSESAELLDENEDIQIGQDNGEEAAGEGEVNNAVPPGTGMATGMATGIAVVVEQDQPIGDVNQNGSGNDGELLEQNQQSLPELAAVDDGIVTDENTFSKNQSTGQVSGERENIDSRVTNGDVACQTESVGSSNGMDGENGTGQENSGTVSAENTAN